MPGATPIYGFPYPDPSDLVANYPALGQDLAEDIEAVLPTLGGVTLITSTALTGSSVSVNDCFSATYTNYRLIIRAVASAGAPDIQMRMRVSATDASGADYTHQRFTASSTTLTGLRQTGLTSHFLDSYDTTGGIKSVDLFNPQLAVPTQLSNTGGYSSTPIILVGYGRHEVSTAYTGFTLLASSGTFAANSSVAVYGYQI
jgi:hypothetical protein